MIEYCFKVRRLPMFAIYCPTCKGNRVFALDIDALSEAEDKKDACTCQIKVTPWCFWAAAVLKGEL